MQIKTIEDMLAFCRMNPNKFFSCADVSNETWEDLDKWCFALESNTAPIKHTTDGFLKGWDAMCSIFTYSLALKDIQRTFDEV